MEGATRVIVVMVMVVGAIVGGVSGQSTPSCANDLSVCLPSISSSSVKPGSNCCSSLKNAVTKDLPCLCNFYNSTAFFDSLKINRTRALEIPVLCGINTNLSQCNIATPASPASFSAPSSDASPSSPGPSSGSDKHNAASKLTWTMKPLWAVGFFCASLIAL